METNDDNNGKVIVVGAGLSGIEATWQLVNRGIPVTLYEMRPNKTTPAHTTSNFGELVCSNSFKSQSMERVNGILKEEMRICGSKILWAADQCSVPAGEALAVDRENFSSLLTAEISSHPLITVVGEEFFNLDPDTKDIILICTGPLTSDQFSTQIKSILGDDSLYFYDAIAPILDADTINRDVVFAASRYDKGTEDYLNCPLNEQEYFRFIHALKSASTVKTRPFEKEIYYQGCMPIETIAGKGDLTLAYGAMKPVGLIDPRTGKRPFAVVQLRAENRSRTAYNMVGFQTKLKYGEQSKVFNLIPGLERVSFLKYGSMHRNTYINGPKNLTQNLSWKKNSNIFFSGQITGVEGYMESAAIGIIVGQLIACKLMGKQIVLPNIQTVIGSLLAYITNPSNMNDYVPQNANWGIIENVGKLQRRSFYHTARSNIRAYYEILSSYFT